MCLCKFESLWPSAAFVLSSGREREVAATTVNDFRYRTA
jgi:hypothetical protein